MKKDSIDPTLTAVTATPSDLLGNIADNQGLGLSPDTKRVMFFRVEGNRLSYVAVAHTDGTGRIPVPGNVANLFNLIRCR
jgi:hypothetical protein